MGDNAHLPHWPSVASCLHKVEASSKGLHLLPTSVMIRFLPIMRWHHTNRSQRLPKYQEWMPDAGLHQHDVCTICSSIKTRVSFTSLSACLAPLPCCVCTTCNNTKPECPLPPCQRAWHLSYAPLHATAVFGEWQVRVSPRPSEIVFVVAGCICAYPMCETTCIIHVYVMYCYQLCNVNSVQTYWFFKQCLRAALQSAGPTCCCGRIHG